MQFAIDIPNFGAFADPHLTAEVAREAGATWWTERINPSRGSLEQQRERVRQGPPRF